MSDMRIGGLASGIDTDSIIRDLMEAERMPLNKMEQEKTKLEWQRDEYRDVNKTFLELDNLALDMKLDRTYQSKEASSSNSAVSAKASSSAGEGRYSLEVTQLASAAYNYSEGSITGGNDEFDPDASLDSQRGFFANGLDESDFEIKTYGKDGEKSHVFSIDSSDSLNDVLKEINDSQIGVRAFYDKNADKVMIERDETGNYNSVGKEIDFGGGPNFLTSTLGLSGEEKGGRDAKFTYNDSGFEITSHDNNYSVNGVDFTLHEVGKSTVNVTNNVDGAVEKITDFVNKYNDIIESLGDKLNERKNRDYPPLTEQQKEAMEEDEIEKWEEQARKGLLQGDSVLSGSLAQMRTSWYSKVESGGEFNILSQIGIETSSNYRDRGKLEIDEEKLRNALSEDASSVKSLFANDGEGEEKGIVRRLEDIIGSTRTSIERKAGKETSTNQSFSLGRELVNVDQRMLSFESKLTQIEDRYWSEFGAMEKAIQEMNSQSAYIQQNFSAGMM
ncbi:flagellar hook-associated protein 2 [Halobacillus campisalis]|uniref:Flagellar hook-associated protein 2 n=1 Tax=Halobacillus campisalis TaxID=435909 RepID=A0ABW2K533_9BACI|nr:flagellar hook-associated protein 2 [Halobacillus campisalis]